jgi:serine/threonine-protein kinase RsbW
VAMVDAFCGAHEVPVAVANRMHLALDEVLSNIVKYAYGASENGTIDVELMFSDNGLTAIVEDTGRPFDPLQLPQRDVKGPLKDRKAGGLGILFMRRLMDSVSYARRRNRNRLTLTIHMPSS